MSQSPAPVPKRIKALDPNVINKIAAGEIIIAPVNALKEVMENSVDAGSTSIEILVKDGGLKLLQISDNGSGIEKDDLGLLCERHTTSKLQAFEDLESIATYGFRGEALSSISQIAHLTVTTKTAVSPVAWTAVYQDGKMVAPKPGQPAEPKASAGRPGTSIKIEDMFYNIPNRRRAFRSPAEEYNKIIDMVGRYAIHCSHVSFTCRKQGDASSGLAIVASASIQDRIRQIHTSAVADELVEFDADNVKYGFKATGFATNANYSHKKTTLLLFINHRCVESTVIRKAIEQTYAPVLPKGGHPFVYLSLEIEPVRVDVNVHPTKREVHFLNEDEIVQEICEAIADKLSEHDKSRTFMTQTLLPGVAAPTRSAPTYTPGSTPGPSSTKRRRYSNSLVRTDNNARKITSMFMSQAPTSDDAVGETKQFVDPYKYETIDRQATKCCLRSIRELRAEVRAKTHEELGEIFRNLTFVGIIDEQKRWLAAQSGVKLYVIDYGRAAYEYTYQIGLSDFGNFGFIKYVQPLDLRGLLRMGAKDELRKDAEANPGSPTPFEIDELVEKVANQLIERREMLLEYFSLEITPEGSLVSMPLLLKGYTPALGRIPRFLLCLGPRVDWTSEKACFETFLRELAKFYAPEMLPPMPHNKEALAREEERIGPAIVKRRKLVRDAIEHVWLPGFKSRMVVTKDMINGIWEVADLKGLYRVFERC